MKLSFAFAFAVVFSGTFIFANELQFDRSPFSNSDAVFYVQATENSGASDFFDEETPEAEPEKVLTQDDIDALNDQLLRAEKEKNFAKQLEIYRQLPAESLDKSKQILIAQLELFERIEKEDKENSELFKTDGDISKAMKVKLSSIYRESQQLYIDGEKKIARDMLIHSIYLFRRNFKAKKFLEYGFDLKIGQYKVENMESKYWNRSSISFYGGNYQDSIDDLEILTYLDRKNFEVYDRLGSSYYMSGQIKKAIGAWETSLYLKPDNPKLGEVIAEAKKLLVKQEEENKARLAARKAAEEEQESAPEVETQVMRVAPQDQAYSYAQALKEQGYTAIVEQLENGKFAVKVPKSELNTSGDQDTTKE